MSYQDSRKNLTELESKGGGKDKRAKGQKGNKGKTTNCNFPFLIELYEFGQSHITSPDH